MSQEEQEKIQEMHYSEALRYTDNAKETIKKINRIIILRFRRVGDSVLSSALCSSLRKTFPEATIDYVLNVEIAPLFENHPDIDRIITFTREEMNDGKTYLKKVRQIMRNGNYDVIIDTRSTIKTLWFALFSLKSPYRIGKKRLCNYFFHNYRINIDFHEISDVVCTLRLLSPLEKKFKVEYDRNFRLYVTPEEKESFRRKMQAGGIDLVRPVIVCTVATRVVRKIWNRERMKEILFRIIEQTNAQLIFNFGGKEEEELAIRLKQEMGNHPAIFTNIKAESIRELAAMIANSDFFFGNEGGPRHISQALDIPSFAIYPPNIKKKKWLPNACDRFQGIDPSDVSEKASDDNLTYVEKFNLITVEKVWEKLNPMLNRYLR
jgi:heptosyltransferase-2